MTTLVARLAGPLQSWGVDPRFRVVGTHPTPTWSALLGLCRAAVGHGRTAPIDDSAWLRSLNMAVRVDQPGQARLDYHTINPLPEAYLRFRGIDTPADLGVITFGEPPSARGTTRRWVLKKRPGTLVTKRAYLHDAAFAWFIEGPDEMLMRLGHALTHPRWAPALGRKGCPPSGPLVLGLHDGAIAEVAALIPVLHSAPRSLRHSSSTSASITVPLVWLTPRDAGSGDHSSVVMDVPLGSHPQDGHAGNVHTHASITAPVVAEPWHALLAWATEHLTQPYLETGP